VDPFIFLANGGEIWFWHRRLYPPRKVSGFFNEDDLLRLAHLDRFGQPLTGAMPLARVIDRAYQIEAVKTIAERIEAAERRFLLVLATGTGKTRVAVALVAVLPDQGRRLPGNTRPPSGVPRRIRRPQRGRTGMMPVGRKPGAQETGGERLAIEAIGRHFALNMLFAVSATG